MIEWDIKISLRWTRIARDASYRTAKQSTRVLERPKMIATENSLKEKMQSDFKQRFDSEDVIVS